MDADTHWKTVIKQLFEDFVAFFLPTLYPMIDFSHQPSFLEQEFPKLLPNKSKEGNKYNDKLVKLKLKQKPTQWLLLHIEVQSYFEVDFAERMFIYFYRIYVWKTGALFCNLLLLYAIEKNGVKLYSKLEQDL